MNRHFNKRLLSSISTIALLTASSPGHAVTAAQLTSAYNSALVAAAKTGFIPDFANDEGWKNVTFQDNLSTKQYAELDGQAAATFTTFNTNGIAVSAETLANPALFANFTYAQAVAGMEHEIGHAMDSDFTYLQGLYPIMPL